MHKHFTKNPDIAFGESIGFEHSSPSMRSYLLPIFLFSLFGLLFLKLAWLALFQGNYYRTLSDSNRIKTELVHAPRGVIFDRNGTPLVLNAPGFRKKVGDKTIVFSKEEAISLIAKGDKGLEADSLRFYPYKDMFSHVLGYIGQISIEELKNPQFSSYPGSDLIGKMGIERAYEKKLRGEDGKILTEVDASSKAIRTLGSSDPIPGEDITLTLDAKLQKAVDIATEHVEKGAVIVSTPKGEILSLVSRPSFDANLFTMGREYKTGTTSGYQNVEEVLLDLERQPVLNRAIAGVYPPGSTFKLVTAAAGLEEKIIDENWRVEDTGVLHIGEFSFANWYFTQYGRTDGTVNIVSGIKRSNDIFFYKLAEKVGVGRLSSMAKRFGLGEPLGIDILGEAGGLVPTTQWKEEVIGEQWYLGDTYHYGIGQGFLLTTPLQVNTWTQAIAAGGTFYKPHLHKSQITNHKSQKFLSEKTISLIRQGMVESCQPGGVAWPLFKLKIKNEKLKIDGKNFLEVKKGTASGVLKGYRELVVACKTGTAEHGGKDDLPHAWITLFAPAYNPEIVVTVLVESAGEGSNVAAPIAKKILEAWFQRN